MVEVKFVALGFSLNFIFMFRSFIVFLFFAVMLYACKSGNSNSHIPKTSADSAKTSKNANTSIKETEQLIGRLNTSFAEYIDLDANGDDELLIVAHNSDTSQYLVRTPQHMPKLTKGDDIKIKWKRGKYRPAGDPETEVDVQFVLAYEVVKQGKLALAKKNGMCRVSYFYDPEMSGYGKEQIDREIRYYLVNTDQPAIRKAVAEKSDLLCMVRKNPDHEEVYDIVINFDEDKPQPIQKLQYSFEKQYQLVEVMP